MGNKVKVENSYNVLKIIMNWKLRNWKHVVPLSNNNYVCVISYNELVYFKHYKEIYNKTKVL